MREEEEPNNEKNNYFVYFWQLWNFSQSYSALIYFSIELAHLTLNIQLISCLSASSSPMETSMMENYIFKLKKNLVIFIWSGRTIFFLDLADACFFAQAKFHKSNTMLSPEQEKNVSAEVYCKSSWKGTLNSLGFLNT